MMEGRREKKSTYIMLKLFLLIVCCMLHITHTLTHPTHTLCTTPITQTHTHSSAQNNGGTSADRQFAENDADKFRPFL